MDHVDFVASVNYLRLGSLHNPNDFQINISLVKKVRNLLFKMTHCISHNTGIFYKILAGKSPKISIFVSLVAKAHGKQEDAWKMI